MAGISITLAGNFAKLDELKDKAGKTANSIKAAFGSNLGKAMFAGVATGATVAFAGVVAAVKSAIDAGGELNDMMARTGAAGKGLVVMQKAFENAGIAAEQVPAVLNKMQKAMAGLNEEGEPTNEAFKKLGLSVNDLVAMDPVDAFQKIQKAISGIQDPAQRTAIAMELFGRSGGQLLAVFQDSGAFSSAAEQVGALGQTLADNAADLDTVGDAFGSIGTKAQQVGAEVAVALMPQLLELSTWLNETDFSAVGEGIGTLITRITDLGGALHDTFKDDTLFTKIGELADWTVGPVDQEAAKKQAAEMADPNYVRSGEMPGANVNGSGITNEKFATESAPSAQAKVEAAAADKAAETAKKKAEADAKSAVEKEKSKAFAAEEYRLEKDILAAKLNGDNDRLARLEREKQIREEMKRLESAGFTAAEARSPAEQKVDAEKKAADSDAARKSAQDEKQRIADTLAGRLQDVRGQIDGQQFQSTIGAVSSMQRFGGGGGAVATGLDYARQTNDLQREANSILRQIADMSRREVEV